MEITTVPDHVKNWFAQRKITEEVLTQNGIGWDGFRIAIPIYDKDKNILFYKYRRDPATDEGPKYQYEAGATRALYGVHRDRPGAVVITEGELDALLLESHGIFAVSSTGGAMSMIKEIAEFFVGRETYACYDIDEAGITGAVRTQKNVPHAKIILLPKFSFQGKDLTDYFQDRTLKDFVALTETARNYPIPADFVEPPKHRKEITKKMTEFRLAAEAMMEEERAFMKNRQWTALTSAFKHYFVKRYETYKSMEKSWKVRYDKEFASDIAVMKTIPISRYVLFDAQGFACCLWHKEKTPSMKYYPENNRVKCFGCGMMEDIIGVVMKIHGTGFKEALKILNRA